MNSITAGLQSLWTNFAEAFQLNFIQDNRWEYLSGGSVDELIASLGLEDKAEKALLKKLKGKNFDTDVKNLMKLGGLNEADAKENAYLISEITAWNDFMKLMELSGKTSEQDINDALRMIDGAVTVEQTAKIKIDIA